MYSTHIKKAARANACARGLFGRDLDGGDAVIMAGVPTKTVKGNPGRHKAIALLQAANKIDLAIILVVNRQETTGRVVLDHSGDPFVI